MRGREGERMKVIDGRRKRHTGLGVGLREAETRRRAEKKRAENEVRDVKSIGIRTEGTSSAAEDDKIIMPAAASSDTQLTCAQT